MAKDSITKAEYLQFVGLDALARQHSRKMNDIREAMYELLGSSDEDDQRGWISDLLWAGEQVTVDHALKGMGVAVKEANDGEVRS